MNLHTLFDKVRENPKRLAAVMSEFLSALDEAIRNIPQIDADRLMDYEQVKGQLVMQVIPVGPNREKLSQIPHKTIEDIAVVYRTGVLRRYPGTAPPGRSGLPDGPLPPDPQEHV